MKILFISSYPPAKEGVGEYTSQMIKSLKTQGVDAKVLTFKTSTESSDSVQRLISWHPSYISKLQKFISQFNPDIIHIQYAVSIYRTYNLLLLIFLKKWKRNLNIKVLITFHEPIKELASLGIIAKIYYKMINHLCDEINVLTVESKNELSAKCGIKPKKIIVIAHGVFSHKEKVDMIEVLKERYGLKNKTVVLFFGYIHADKGLDVLIEAFDILLKNYLDIHTKIMNSRQK